MSTMPCIPRGLTWFQTIRNTRRQSVGTSTTTPTSRSAMPLATQSRCTVTRLQRKHIDYHENTHDRQCHWHISPSWNDYHVGNASGNANGTRSRSWNEDVDASVLRPPWRPLTKRTARFHDLCGEGSRCTMRTTTPTPCVTTRRRGKAPPRLAQWYRTS